MKSIFVVLVVLLSAPSFAELKINAGEGCVKAMRKLSLSNSEGEDRLKEKGQVVKECAEQYKGNKTMAALSKQCRKYERDAVTTLQLVSDCVLAAYNYANSIHDLDEDSLSN